MPKIFMSKIENGVERVIPVEAHSLPAREAHGWKRVTPGHAEKVAKATDKEN